MPVRLQLHRHRFDRPTSVVARSVLNGLHHEYSPIARAAWVSFHFCGAQRIADRTGDAALRCGTRAYLCNAHLNAGQLRESERVADEIIL
jgi:hypothetical protein